MSPAQAMDAALGQAAGLFADAIEAMAETYAAGGAMAVAEQAWVPGGPPKEQIAADYESWVAGARRGRAAA